MRCRRRRTRSATSVRWGASRRTGWVRASRRWALRRCILHSEKQWAIDTAERIAAKLNATDKLVQAAYPINTDDPLAPFLADIAAAARDNQGDMMMCGHVDYLLRAASKLVCGDETCKVVEFKPGNGTVACLEGQGDDWFVSWMWRQDHAAG